jgi:hypothetical protein
LISVANSGSGAGSAGSPGRFFAARPNDHEITAALSTQLAAFQNNSSFLQRIAQHTTTPASFAIDYQVKIHFHGIQFQLGLLCILSHDFNFPLQLQIQSQHRSPSKATALSPGITATPPGSKPHQARALQLVEPSPDVTTAAISAEPVTPSSLSAPASLVLSPQSHSESTLDMSTSALHRAKELSIDRVRLLIDITHVKNRHRL